MLWTIAVIMLVLWLLGLVTSFTLGGFIHLLLVAAIVLVAVRLIQGRTGDVGSVTKAAHTSGDRRCA